MLEYLLTYGTYSLILGGLLAAGAGLPIPEDVYIMASGALSQRGTLYLPAAVAVCWVGVAVGDVMLFHIARKLGGAFYRKPYFRRVLPPERRERIARIVEKRGGLAILVARNLPGFRAPVFAIAALHGMPAWRFIVFDLIGLCVSLPLYFSLGYVFADNVTLVREQVATTTWAIALGVAALLLVVAILVYVKRSRVRE